MDITTTFPYRLTSLLVDSGDRDQDLAAVLGMSKATVNAWRNGTRTPKPPMVRLIAAHYGVSPEWLSGADVPREPSGPAPRHTVEARIISHGVDAMPPEARARAVRMFELMFAEYADKFNDEEETYAP